MEFTEGQLQLAQWQSGYDFAGYSQACLTIRDHDTARLLQFDHNKGQRILHAVAEKQKEEKGYVRIDLLKSRRFGGSTYVEARFYRNATLNHNRNIFIVGHEERSTATLFRMAQLFHEKNPLAPSVLASNAQELRFDNKEGTGLKSEYQLGTAKNLTTGKSQGIHDLHGSEEAFWPTGADELLLNLFQCIPDPPAWTEVFRESTANGYGNTFQEAVFEAYCEGQYPYYEEDGVTYAWSNPETDWVLVFIPWFAIEKYTREFLNDEEKRKLKVSLKEKAFDEKSKQWVDNPANTLQKKYKLTLEQLNWRRWAINNKCNGSLDKFNQEYPAEVLDAFLSKGSNVFSKELCDQLESECVEPLIIGKVNHLMGKTRVERQKYGEFRVWEKCKQEDSYFITVDCAGGKILLTEAQKKENKEPDRTNIDVWNHRSGMQAAQWNGHVDYSLIGDLVAMIGSLYGIEVGNKIEFPVAAVELQNHGYTAVADLTKLSYPQYEWKDGEPGWSTNRGTKHVMIDSSIRSVSDGELKINCKETIAEMRTYIEEPGVADNRKFHAAGTAKDDRVITMAIAGKLLLLLPRKYNELRKNRRAAGASFANIHDAPKDTEYLEVYA